MPQITPRPEIDDLIPGCRIDRQIAVQLKADTVGFKVETTAVNLSTVCVPRQSIVIFLG